MSRRKPWRYGTIERGGPRLIVLPEKELQFQVAFAQILLESKTFAEYERRCRAAGRRFVDTGLFFVRELEDDFLDPDADFDIAEIPGAGDGTFPPFLETVMLKALPDSIGDFGEIQEPMFDSPYLEVDPGELDLVIARFRELGIDLVEDQDAYDVLQALIEAI